MSIINQNKPTDLSAASPQAVRCLIRAQKITGPTSGMCSGYAQANLVILPKDYALEFMEYVIKNPKPCPLLEMIPNDYHSEFCGRANLLTDIPRYRVYRDGKLAGSFINAERFWLDDMYSFLIGCSFSFEEALIKGGIEVRHITLGCNVPMFKTNIQTTPAGHFHGPLVVSMRPVRKDLVQKAWDITAKFPHVHGEPIFAGDPAKIGIQNIMKPDYGDSVPIGEDEVPVFWACGVTPQAAVENAKPPIVITHSPGHMFITDILNSELDQKLSERTFV